MSRARSAAACGLVVAAVAALLVLSAGTASAALPNTTTPTLSLVRTIQTEPFVGTTTFGQDAEGSAFVPNDPAHPNRGGTDSLFLADDDGKNVWEIDPYSGALKSRLSKTDWATVRQYSAATGTGTGALTTSNNYVDLEGIAYDAANDVLYVFNGKCCSSSVKPTAYRLVRQFDGSMRPDSYQPLAAGSDFTGAAWNPADGKVYVGVNSVFRTYDYASNTAGSTFSITGVNSILGMSFSDDGSELYVVNGNVRLMRVNWTTRTLLPGWLIDLTPFGMLDSRGVDLIGDQFYVYDGNDFRDGSPLSHAVFVFDVCCSSGTGAPTASFGSTQVASPARTIQFTDTSTGSPTSWSWSFGDGTSSTQQSPLHTYAAAGTYTVTLTASNAGGSTTSSRSVSVVGAPKASFTAAQQATPANTVRFTDTSTGGPTAWSWSFGDGTSSTTQSPTHTYAAIGTYTVTLTASNAGGSSTATRQVTVTSGTTAPTASFTSTQVASPARTVQFTDTSTGVPTAWSWSFGDGTSSTAQSPSHTYAAPGTYTVTLTASNAGGGTSSSAQVTVADGGGSGGTLVLTPTADGYVASNATTTSYGTTTNLHVKTASSSTKRALFQFAVTGLQGRTVTSAKLRVYVTDASTTAGSVFTAGTGWTESGLTWNTQPAIGSTALSTGAAAPLGAYVEFDLAGAVTGDGTVGLAITSPSSDTVYYASRETATPPQLVITYQ